MIKSGDLIALDIGAEVLLHNKQSKHVNLPTL